MFINVQQRQMQTTIEICGILNGIFFQYFFVHTSHEHLLLFFFFIRVINWIYIHIIFLGRCWYEIFWKGHFFWSGRICNLYFASIFGKSVQKNVWRKADDFLCFCTFLKVPALINTVVFFPLINLNLIFYAPNMAHFKYFHVFFFDKEVQYQFVTFFCLFDLHYRRNFMPHCFAL